VASRTIRKPEDLPVIAVLFRGAFVCWGVAFGVDVRSLSWADQPLPIDDAHSTYEPGVPLGGHRVFLFPDRDLVELGAIRGRESS